MASNPPRTRSQRQESKGQAAARSLDAVSSAFKIRMLFKHSKESTALADLTLNFIGQSAYTLAEETHLCNNALKI